MGEEVEVNVTPGLAPQFSLMDSASAQEVLAYLSQDETLFNHIVPLRWPDDVRCLECGEPITHYSKRRSIWQCGKQHQRRSFSAKTGTLLENSRVSLPKWLFCIWVIANPEHYHGTYRLAAHLGITQKSAWGVVHRIRLASENLLVRSQEGQAFLALVKNEVDIASSSPTVRFNALASFIFHVDPIAFDRLLSTDRDERRARRSLMPNPPGPRSKAWVRQPK